MAGVTTTQVTNPERAPVHALAEARPALPLGPASPEEQRLIERDRHLNLPLVHPDRQPFRFDVPGAIRHFRIFRQDKEKTSEVFHIFDCLPWRTVADAAASFLATPRGQAVYASEPFLPDILDDHDRLRRSMPKGSLGHEYCDYMETESLSAAGLVAEYEDFRGDRVRLDDKVEWYIDRLRDTHDLLHILTGIGRDTLGEQCLLAFVHGQRPSPGHLFLGYAGALVTKANSRWNVPVLRAAREARQIGRHTPRICEESILELLSMPSDAVRARMNLRPARYYQEVHRMWHAAGVDPHKVLVKAG
jgi:ubiquinone biosynthesis protein COQ4